MQGSGKACPVYVRHVIIYYLGKTCSFKANNWCHMSAINRQPLVHSNIALGETLVKIVFTIL